MREMREKSYSYLFILLFLITGKALVLAADVRLAWDPVSFPDHAGYRLYRGPSPGNYGPPLDVGITTDYTVTGLAAGTWYFAVTAYDIYGNESGYSNERWPRP